MTRVGLLVPQYGASAADALSTARAADVAGLDVWVAGQLIPISGSKDKSALEPLTLMGAIAEATERARLGFMVLAAPYLPPFYTAKALLTLDELSGGRLEAGLGAGWREEEFEGLGLEVGKFSERLGVLEAVIDALDELAGEPADSPRWPPTGPPGVQRPRPPVWLAGSGPKVLRAAARRGDWTNFARGISIEDFTAKVQQVAELAQEEGREPPAPSLTGTFMTGPNLERSLAERAAMQSLDVAEYRRKLLAANVFVGTAEEVADQLRPFQEAGSRAFVLWPLDADHESAPEALAEVARLL